MRSRSLDRAARWRPWEQAGAPAAAWGVSWGGAEASGAGFEVRPEDIERARRVAEAGERLRTFLMLARRWTYELVAPRLERLAEAFPNARRVRIVPGEHRVSVAFYPCDVSPVFARIAVGLSLARDTRAVRVTVVTSIVPWRTEETMDESLELGLEKPDLARLETFLETQIVRFVVAYIIARAAGQEQGTPRRA
ncbi:MAG: hypothetical protein HZC42_07925 [Candidatus Eisenbacteria bacterium]|nr:hypothetical protein [Candidatus Eisenbacteria bacterium]